jgi:hypothetical protein
METAPWLTIAATTIWYVAPWYQATHLLCE